MDSGSGSGYNSDSAAASLVPSAHQLRERRQERRHAEARVSLILAVLLILLAGFATCHCPSFFAIAAVCSAIALIVGSRKQRVVAAGLLILSTGLGVWEIVQIRRLDEGRQQRRAMLKEKGKPAPVERTSPEGMDR